MADLPYNPFKILGVHRQTSPEDVAKAYKELSKLHHPDKGGSTEVFQRLSEAYRLLTNRIAFSQWLRLTLEQNGTCPYCRGNGAVYRQRGLTEKVFTACDPCGGAGIHIRR